MKLLEIYESILLEKVPDDFKNRYVKSSESDDSKIKISGREYDKISQDTFDEIINLEQSYQGKSKKIGTNFAIWLIKKVVTNDLKAEDVYKYGDNRGELGFISLLSDPNIQKYLKDNPLKAYNNTDELESAIIQASEKNTEFQEVDKFLVSEEGIKELKSAKIEYLGDVSAGGLRYQCFKVPKGNLSEKAWKVYRKHLAKCGGSSDGSGAKINICTMASHEHYTDYVSSDDLYVFFNLNDRDAPYQFHYDNSEFRDRKNSSVI